MKKRIVAICMLAALLLGMQIATILFFMLVVSFIF